MVRVLVLQAPIGIAKTFRGTPTEVLITLPAALRSSLVYSAENAALRFTSTVKC